jgi:hypothetical protein
LRDFREEPACSADPDRSVVQTTHIVYRCLHTWYTVER